MGDPFDYDPYGADALAGRVAPLPQDPRDAPALGHDRISFREGLDMLRVHMSKRSGDPLPPLSEAESPLFLDPKGSYREMCRYGGIPFAVCGPHGKVRLMTGDR